MFLKNNYDAVWNKSNSEFNKIIDLVSTVLVFLTSKKWNNDSSILFWELVEHWNSRWHLLFTIHQWKRNFKYWIDIQQLLIDYSLGCLSFWNNGFNQKETEWLSLIAAWYQTLMSLT